MKKYYEDAKYNAAFVRCVDVMSQMLRKDFCKLVHIPYRTMTEWELDNRHAPDYVLWLLEYYIRNEGLMVKEMNEGGGDSEKETT